MYRARELSAKDIPTINKWRQPELASHIGGTFRYIDLAVEEMWYQNYLQNRHTTVRIVVADDNDVPIALASLTNIDHQNQIAQIHLMVGDPHRRGQGIGAYAGLLAVKHAFMDLNLNKLEAKALITNTQAISMNKNAGFVEEGVLRKHVFKDGEFVDVVLLGLLKEEAGSAIQKLDKFEQRMLRRKERAEAKAKE